MICVKKELELRAFQFDLTETSSYKDYTLKPSQREPWAKAIQLKSA